MQEEPSPGAAGQERPEPLEGQAALREHFNRHVRVIREPRPRWPRLVLALGLASVIGAAIVAGAIIASNGVA